MIRYTPLLLALAGCVKSSPRSAPDYVPGVVTALATGSSLAGLLRIRAVVDDDQALCFAAGAGEVLASVGARALAERWSELPVLEVDLSTCVALRPPEGLDVAPAVRGGLDAALRTAENLLVVTGMSLAETDCQAYKVASGVVSWIIAATPAVLDELENPDGRIEIPGLAVEACP